MLFPKRRDFEINNSMHHAILNLTNDRLTSSKKDQLTLGGFIDLLKKVFDFVDHSILLQKLELHEVKGKSLSCFNSYLF